MRYVDIAKEVLLTEANELTLAASAISDEITKAVELISNATGKLVVIGVGKSGLVGAKMAATFASTGTSSFFLHPTEAMHGDLGMISKGDVVLAIRQRGTKVHAGNNVGMGKDHTLFALIDGEVKFEQKDKNRKKVSVYAS